MIKQIHSWIDRNTDVHNTNNLQRYNICAVCYKYVRIICIAYCNLQRDLECFFIILVDI